MSPADAPPPPWIVHPLDGTRESRGLLSRTDRYILVRSHPDDKGFGWLQQIRLFHEAGERADGFTRGEAIQVAALLNAPDVVAEREWPRVWAALQQAERDDNLATASAARQRLNELALAALVPAEPIDG